MVYRVFVEKKEGLRHEAKYLLDDIRSQLGITALSELRLINRYDVENISNEEFSYAVKTVLSELQLDNVSYELDCEGAKVFAVEYLPGQFDQRADSAAQCMQIISRGAKPEVRTAHVYMLFGSISDKELSDIKKYLINPVESREASMEKPASLKTEYAIPETVDILDGFNALDADGLRSFIEEKGLAMDLDDIAFCQQYFRSENRDPSITEIKVIDTYWSDHCRHTTFTTTIDSVSFDDEEIQKSYEEYIATRKGLNRTKPINLMDLATIAASGYSSYGNQIGLATGIVDELYHPGYAAKRMEIGAVIAAAPEANIRRESPEAGDLIILLGNRTGRDGCGGATGSSKSHTLESLESCGAEVQKGNAPEERKLQRLFRNHDACRMIKRCNDFGAGGVSVAVGELVDGLNINLNSVTRKYEGLDGTELAISESQERMAVVVEKENCEKFIALAQSENLEATVIAEVTDEARLVMNWNSRNIVNISREF